MPWWVNVLSGFITGFCGTSLILNILGEHTILSWQVSLAGVIFGFGIIIYNIATLYNHIRNP